MFNNKAVSGCYFVGQQLSIENTQFYKQVMAFFSLPAISCSNTFLSKLIKKIYPSQIL